MASSSQSLKFEKAIWDGQNVGIFLSLLVEEIDAGNRPSGHFTRAAWNTITQKFVSSSGCNFTMTQLKHKWDNLKKEFALWEKLLLEETGLGYDESTSRIVADAAWWRKKLQEKPEYRRFRTHGPLHLDLQERVFRGTVATGYMEYIPHCDPNLNLHPQSEDVEDVDTEYPNGNDTQNVEVDVEEATAPTQTPSRPNVPKGKPPKRKRTRTNSTKQTVADVNENFMEVINIMKAESASSIMMRSSDKSISFGDAIDMLRALPWMDVKSPCFTAGLVLLEDEKKRIAFSHIVDLGEEVVKNWMEAWKK